MAVMVSLRDKLAKIPSDAAMHLVNGMLFEAYFDNEGKFRGNKLKRRYFGRLLELQKVRKFEPSIALFGKNSSHTELNSHSFLLRSLRA